MSNLRPFPALYGIVNTHDEAMAAQFASKLLGDGLQILQLREKEGDIGRMERVAHLVVKEARRLFHIDGIYRWVIINDFTEVCLTTGADGVHIGKSDGTISGVRARLGYGLILGYSTTALREVKALQEEPADYFGFGPVFATPSKRNHDVPTGIDSLIAAVQVSKIPIVAIGGIGKDNIHPLLSSGVASLCAIRMFEELPYDELVDEVERTHVGPHDNMRSHLLNAPYWSVRG